MYSAVRAIGRTVHCAHAMLVQKIEPSCPGLIPASIKFRGVQRLQTDLNDTFLECHICSVLLSLFCFRASLYIRGVPLQVLSLAGLLKIELTATLRVTGRITIQS